MRHAPDSDYVRKIMKEFDLGAPKKVVVKLPCGHESQEVTYLGDQMLQCGICYRKAILAWSKREGHVKWK